MFIAILTYKKPLSEVDKHLATHREFLAAHYAAGNFIASGPQTPRIGGVIKMTAGSRAAVDSIISQDPFYVNAIADYQIVEFTPTMLKNEELEQIIK
ncbi:MAG: YciI family protein [Prevotella sp.]|nr:YciI family protein [Prevotella sp.]MDO4934549.1 YciI family protein [Prevotella sp.]